MSKIFGYRSLIATTTGEIGQLRNIDGPGSASDDVDTTTMDSTTNFRTFIQGLNNPGEVTMTAVYDPALASHTKLAAFHAQRLTRNWTIYHGSSTGASDTFLAYVKGVGRAIPMDNVITCEFTLKVSGTPGYST